MKAPISRDEAWRLSELETIVERGKKTFVEVGLALAEIRDARLYRRDFKSFEDYCREKWQFTKTYANNLIEGAEVVKQLPAKLTTIVVNEGQAREVAKLPVPHRAPVLEAVIANGPVTAKAIKNEAAKRLPVPTKPPEKTIVLPGPVDDLGFKIPIGRARESWARKAEVQEVLSQLGKLRAMFKRLQGDEKAKTKDRLWAWTSANSVYANLNQAYADVKASLPHTVCTTCQGKTADNCTLCRGNGVLSEYAYLTVSVETKAIREKAKQAGQA